MRTALSGNTLAAGVKAALAKCSSGVLCLRLARQVAGSNIPKLNPNRSGQYSIPAAGMFNKIIFCVRIARGFLQTLLTSQSQWHCTAMPWHAQQCARNWTIRRSRKLRSSQGRTLHRRQRRLGSAFEGELQATLLASAFSLKGLYLAAFVLTKRTVYHAAGWSDPEEGGKARWQLAGVVALTLGTTGVRSVPWGIDLDLLRLHVISLVTPRPHAACC